METYQIENSTEEQRDELSACGFDVEYSHDGMYRVSCNQDEVDDMIDALDWLELDWTML